MNFLLAAAAFALVVFWPQNLAAQNGETDKRPVNISVSVTDKKGNPVGDLKSSDFEVLVDGKQQEILSFASGDSRISYGFVYDLHPSASDSIRNVLLSVDRFKKGLPETDDFFMVVFNDRGSLALEFVPTTDQVRKHLSLGSRNEPSSLFDAIFLAAEKTEERRSGKKALIIISDGKDDDSHHGYSELREKLRSLNLQVFVVFAGEDQDSKYSDLSLEVRPRNLDQDLTLDKAALNEMALKSGGRSASPESLSGYQLGVIYERIAIEMKNRYSLAIASKESDGKYHKIEVRVRSGNGEKYRVDHRSGFVGQK